MRMLSTQDQTSKAPKSNGLDQLVEKVQDLQAAIVKSELLHTYAKTHENCRSEADEHNNTISCKLIVTDPRCPKVNQNKIAIEIHIPNDNQAEFAGFIITDQSGTYTVDTVHDHIYFEKTNLRYHEVQLNDGPVFRELCEKLFAKFFGHYSH